LQLRARLWNQVPASTVGDRCHSSSNVVPNSDFIALVTKVQRVIKWLTLPSSGQPRGTGFAAQVKR
jgi:hypothetical protein